jgi:hypothetical protein
MKQLWPYGTAAALLAAVSSWIILASALLLSRRYALWPDAAAMRPAAIVILAIGLVPVALYIIDYLASTHAVVGIAGLRLDFSQAGPWNVTRTAIELPANLGLSAPLIADSTALKFDATLSSAREVVCLDLGRGDEWWVTRLLVFAAGAVRLGMPKAFVFVGTKHNKPGVFLGWAQPKQLLDALHPVERYTSAFRLPTFVTYGQLYDRARCIALQLAMFAPSRVPLPPIIPTAPAGQVPSPLTPDAQRYLESGYWGLGDAALEQILMDQVAIYGLETPPDHLSEGRLVELFAHCLYTLGINISHPKDRQLAAFMEIDAPYAILLEGDRYEGVIERVGAERSLLKQIFVQITKGGTGASTK